MEHPFLMSSLGVILTLVLGFLWHKTKPSTNTAEATELPSCSHPKKTGRIFRTQTGTVLLALPVCPACMLVLPPYTPTVNRLTPEELREIRASLTAEGYDVSALPDPDA